MRDYNRYSMSEADDFSAVPLFPLPSVVLFPRAVLPLHIFEQRYRIMTADALTGDRLVAMALLKPGWEKNYYCRPAIEAVVCIGKILSYERLADGKYNFLLQGVARARIVNELPVEKPYRLAELSRVEQVPAMEIDLEEDRRRFETMFANNALGQTPAGKQFTRIINSALPTCEVADLAAFTFIDDVTVKQSLLAEPDVRARVQRTLELLCEANESVAHAAARAKPSLN